MQIIANTGVDNILLGMTKEQIEALLGSPAETEDFYPLEEQEDEKTEVWRYAKGLELNFSADDNFLLGTISIVSPQVEFKQIKPIGLSLDELKQHFPQLELDYDFLDSGQDYTDLESQLSFWVVNNIVEQVTIFPLYDEKTEEPIWPKASYLSI